MTLIVNSILTNLLNHLYQLFSKSNKTRENSRGHLVQSPFSCGSNVDNYEKYILETCRYLLGRVKRRIFKSHCCMCR